MHELEIAVQDGAASWCSCTCGWVSEKAPEAKTSAAWVSHVAESALLRYPRV